MTRTSGLTGVFWQRLFAALCLVLLTAGSLHPTASAQSDEEIDEELQEAGVVSATEWESPQFGAVVTWTDDWFVYDDASTYTDPDGAIDGLGLGSESVTFQATIIESPGETPAEYMERVVELRSDPEGVEDFEIIDQGDDGDVAFLTYTGTSDANAFFSAAEVDYFDEADDLLQYIVISAWVEDAESAFEATQADIEVDGDEPFVSLTVDDVIVPDEVDADDPTPDDSESEDAPGDAADEEDAPGGADDEEAPDASEDDEETPDASEDDEETPDASEDDEEAPDASADDEETPDATDEDEETPDATDEDEETPDASADDEETPDAGDDAAADDLVDLGLIDDGEYVSPQFGGEVTWSADWEVAEDFVTSDTDILMDNLYLEDQDLNVFQTTFFVSEDETPEEYVDRLIGFRTDFESTEDLTVIDQGEIDDRYYVIYSVTETNGATFYVLSEVAVYDEVDEVLMKNEMFVLPSDAQDLFDAIQADIEVDGEPPFLFDDPLPDPEEP